MYQPEWRNGKEHGRGKRDAASRYQAIAERIAYAGLRPGFTVLDFGAYGGYFSARLAEEFGAVCTAVDDSPKLKPAPGITVINERVTPSGIAKLGTFDVVLCLSVLHHSTNWRNYLEALTEAAGELLFVETANPDETLPKAKAHNQSKAIHTAVERAGGEVIVKTAGYDSRYARPVWVITTKAVEPEGSAIGPTEIPDLDGVF